MQLLVEQRDTLTVGDILPVGDLFDVIAHGDEAFSQDMAIHFDNAKRLYIKSCYRCWKNSMGDTKTSSVSPTTTSGRWRSATTTVC